VGIQNASNNVVGLGNVISANKQSGVAIGTNAPGNFVQGNFIGLDNTGTNALANAFYGVSIVNASNNVVGGTNAIQRNVISGNLLSGIYLSGTTATGNSIFGNFIGTSVTGKKSVPNTDGGVRVEGPGNVIGGAISGAGNLISGNGKSGIYITNASLNLISGNFIGTDVTGTSALGNAIAGIAILNASSNTIGGTTPGERNLLSGNTNSGLYMVGSGAKENRVQGNFIGTDFTGTTAVPNQLGGIYLYGAPTNYLGGSVPGSGNLVSGNKAVAISIGDPGSIGNFVQGNWIGVKADGLSALGNQWHGVEILNTSSNNVIGGTILAAGNRIAFAQTPLYTGVRIRDGSDRNLIRFNSIFSNPGLGIDLGTAGTAANDVGDLDSGANDLQNFPVITSVNGLYITTIKGTFNSRASRSYTLDFYASPSADASGYGEGQQWIGQTTVTTAADGNASFSFTATNTTGVWPYISATATAPANNTSEFSLCSVVNPNLVDSDGDGLPDEFETAAGLNPFNANDAGLDLDGDGSSNLSEYGAGTDPNDAEDFLRVENFRLAGNSAGFDFGSLIGKTYSVQFSTNLNTGWLGLAGATNVAGTGLKLNITDNSAGTAQRFYRIRVP
jgi:titin